MVINPRWSLKDAELRLFCLGLCLVFGHAVSAAVVGLPNWMPWGEEDNHGNKRGFFVDTLSYLMQGEAPAAVLKLVPGNRLLRGYGIREWDFGVFFCDQNFDKYQSIGRLIAVEQVLIVRNESPYQSEFDLQHATVARARITMAAPLAIETRPDIKIVMVEALQDALRILQVGRVDASIISRQGFAWLLRKQPEKLAGLRALPIAGSKRYVCLYAAKDLAPERLTPVQQHFDGNDAQVHLNMLQNLYFGEQDSAETPE